MSIVTPIPLGFSLTLIANAPNAMVLAGQNGQIIAINNAAERLFGYEPDELIGEMLETLMPERFRSGHDLMRRHYLAQPLPRLMGSGRDLKGQRKDGSEFDIEVGLNAVSTPDGLAILASLSDITSRKSAENRERFNKDLFDAIFRSSPFCIVTTDTRGVITAANPAAERLLWYSMDELVGQRALYLIHDPEMVQRRAEELGAELDEPIKADHQILTHIARLRGSEEIDWQYIRKDGTPIPVKLTKTALRDQNGYIVGFLGMACDLRDQRRTQQYINHIALHDELTGLPNRTQFHSRLDSAVAQHRTEGRKLAVLLVDLDNFKRFNDSLGHNIGDQILLHVASTLKLSVDEAALVARMGGDEFVVILEKIEDEEVPEAVAEAIISRVSEPMSVGRHTLKITPSIGVALFPEHADDPDTLVARADTAMYAAKERGRSNYQLFNDLMARQLSERVELEHALQQALDLDQFSLHYQSQVDLKTGQTVGVETLLRWELPGTGSISPARFIHIAEESELILPIGEWVLRRACEDGVKLQRVFEEPCVVAVNLSPRQLMQKNLVALVADALQSSGLPPELLELEVTENIFMHHAEELETTLHRLRDVGVRISIDDFGTGYSSLAYITRFPIDRIKLDLSFVQNMLTDPNCRAVTNAVIAMANGLGVDVVAEGVETSEQLDYLGQQNCTHGQGYLFARPAPLEQWLGSKPSLDLRGG